MNESASTFPLIKRHALIEQHRSYVRALAIEILQSLALRVELNEMVACGHVGLVEAAERFDARRGVAFSTFAHYRIKGAIYDGLRQMGLISSSQGSRRARFANADDLLHTATEGEHSYAADSAATSSNVDDDIAAAQSLIDVLIPVYFLSLESDTVPEIVDYNAMTTEKLEEFELIGFVIKLIAELSEDDQQLIDALYFKHLSMTELAARMNTTKSWISRLHARAIRHLRDRMQQRGMLEAS